MVSTIENLGVVDHTDVVVFVVVGVAATSDVAVVAPDIDCICICRYCCIHIVVAGKASTGEGKMGAEENIHGFGFFSGK